MGNVTSRLAALSAVMIVFVGAHLHRGTALENRQALRVLFVGNSLTYTNDLPGIVTAFARADGQRAFESRTIAYPNYSLEDHWNNQDARREISKGRWDYVVLQQGPSASKEGRALLLDYSRRFAEEIRKIGGKPALYSVWPSANRMQDFRGVSESYRQAAEAVEGIVFPVGDAWLNAWTVSPTLELYSSDGFHPSAAGSYLAGLVIYEQLYNRSPIGPPARLLLNSGGKIEIPADQALLLQNAAQKANKLSVRR